MRIRLSAIALVLALCAPFAAHAGACGLDWSFTDYSFNVVRRSDNAVLGTPSVHLEPGNESLPSYSFNKTEVTDATLEAAEYEGAVRDLYLKTKDSYAAGNVTCAQLRSAMVIAYERVKHYVPSSEVGQPTYWNGLGVCTNPASPGAACPGLSLIFSTSNCVGATGATAQKTRYCAIQHKLWFGTIEQQSQDFDLQSGVYITASNPYCNTLVCGPAIFTADQISRMSTTLQSAQ